MNARLLSASVAVLFVGTASAAYAQDDFFARDRNTSVRERPRPDYEALGIGSGGIRLLPQATVTVTHDDNIFATSTNEVSDVITTVVGEVVAFSDWNVHQIGATARVRNDSYADFGFEDATTYNLLLNGRLDGTRNFSLNGAVSYDGLVEPRTASGNPSASVDPIEYSIAGWDLGSVYTLNKLRLRGGVMQRAYDFDNGRTASGAVIDQSYRDMDHMRGNVRADYAVSPDTSLFVDLGLDKREYDRLTPGTLLIRDSDGYDVTAGADFDITNLIRGSVQLGYLEQDFDDPLIPDASAVSGRLGLEYFPTEIATVTIRADRTIQDTGLLQTSAFLASNYSAQLDYELLRNVILTARVAFGDDDYQGLARRDKRTSTTIAAVWLLNRRWGLSGDYNFQKQNSTGLNAGPDFTVHRISASLTLQY